MPIPINATHFLQGGGLVDDTVYSLTEDMTIYTPFALASGSSGVGIIVDGNGFTLTVEGSTPWPGLFPFSAMVWNLGIDGATNAVGLADYSGWFFGMEFGGSATNCWSNGVISGSQAGGIFGLNSSGTAMNCYSLGDITGVSAAGIFGPSAYGGSAINCYSAGVLSGPANGGIFSDDGPGTATNCYFANGSWSDTAANAALTVTSFIVPSLFVSPWVSNNGMPFTLAITTGIPDRDYRIKDPLTQAAIPDYRIDVSGGAPYFAATGSSPVLINLDASTNSVTCSDGSLYSFSLTSSSPITFSDLTLTPSQIVITQAWLSTNGYTLNTLNTYTLGEDITVTQPFNVIDQGLVFDGSGNKITIDASTWSGLFINTTTVRNLGVDGATNSVSLDTRAGWFFASGLGGSATNCYSLGAISGSDAGGIFGYSSAGTATNCHSLGAISGVGAGGIFGYLSTGTATNCYSEGSIGETCGGIFGLYGLGTATNCYSLGDIVGTGAGGIFGTTSSGTATNCYSRGAMSGTKACGIFGDNSATGTAINCYSAGFLSGPSNGGIFIDGQGTATNCYFANGSWSDAAANAALVTSFIVPSLFVSPWVSNGGAPFTLGITTGIPDREYLIRDPNTQAAIPDYHIDVSGGAPYFVATGSPPVLINMGAPTNSVIFSDGLAYTFSLTSSSPIAFSGLTLAASHIIITQAWLLLNRLTLNPMNTYTLGEDITVTQPFNVSDNGLVFDGSGNKIIVNATTWSGLFNKDTAVQNLGVDGSANSVSLDTWAGWFFASGVVGGSATNCHSLGAISGSDAGGIFGNGSAGTATNCHSLGAISGVGAGGIFGNSCAGTATNCYSEGSIGVNCGGIFGLYGSGTATNCYSLGAIIGINAGGIFGNGSPGTATNCYSEGSIDQACGGIFGNGSAGTATNCYSLGAIIGPTAGGIFGPGSSGTAINCYSAGFLSGPSNGGIFIDDGQGTATNCYFANGSWSDTAANAALVTSFIVPSLLVSPWASNGGMPFTLAFPVGIPDREYLIRDPNTQAAIPDYRIDVSGGAPYFVATGSPPVLINMGAPTNSITLSDGRIYSFSLTSSSPITFSGLTQASLIITQAWLSTNGYTLNPINPYTLGENITVTQPFEVSDHGLAFDGSGSKITINASTWSGLFNKVTTVRNLGVDGSANSVTLNESAGWFFASGVSGSATNCWSTGSISSQGGGIFGNGGTVTATNCWSTGSIGNLGGGIFANGGNGTATNCWSSGSIGDNGGGIFGANGGGNATNCYSLGDIGSGAGGIFGIYSSGPAINCYSAGVIGNGSNGIYAGNNSTGTNCYVANGNWTDTAANMDLSGVPLVDNTIWSYNRGNPYTLSPLDGSGNPVSMGVVTTLSTTLANNGTLPPSGTPPSIVAAVLAATSNPTKIKSLVAFVAVDAHVTGSTAGFAALAALSGQVIPLDMSGSAAVYSYFDWTNNTNAAALQALPLVVSVPDTTTTPGTNLIVFPPTGNNNLIAINTTVDASYNFILPPSVPQITSGYGINVVSGVQYFFSPLSGAPLAIETGTVLTVTDMSGGSYSTTILDLDLATTGAEVTPPPSPPSPQTILITQQWIDASGYALDAINTYLLYETISVSQPFDVSGSGLVFNGLNNSVNVSGSAWAGLFSGDGITVTNLTMNALGTTLAAGAGLMFASGTTNSTATWCTIQANGGLFGSACVGCTATHCMNGQGAVAENGGSIFGAGCISCSAVTCNSSALLAGSNAGGIFGADASGCNATGCFYNLLAKNGTFGVFAGCGGIFGNSCLDVSATDCATNCPIADGVVDGTLIGGIFGTNCTGSMSNCYFVSADISGNVTCSAYGSGSTITGYSNSDPVFNGSNATAAVGDLNPQSPPGLIGGDPISACAAVLVAAAPTVAFNLLTAARGQGTYAITEQSIVLGAAYAVKYSGDRAIYGVIQPGAVIEISASFATTYYSLFPTMGELGSDPRSLDLTIITPSSSVLPAISTTKNTLIVIGDDPCTITTLSDTITATAVNGVPLVAGRNMVFYQSANSPYCKVYGTELLVGPRLSGYLTNAAKIVEDMIASPSTAVAAGRAYGMNNAALILAAATAGTTSKSTSIYTFLANAIGAQSATFSAGQAAPIYQNFESRNTDTTRSLQVSIPNAGVVNIGSTTNNNMVLIDISLNATYTFAAPILSTYSLSVANTVQTLNGPDGSTVLAINGTVTLKDTAGNSYILTIRDLDTAWSMTVVSGPICFFGNAPVLTPSGYRRMDSLRIGDLVSTPAGPVAIERVFKKDYAASATTNPYVIPKGTLGATKRLLISPNHRVAVGGKMVEACDPSLGLEQVAMDGTLTYYNLQLSGWANMTVAGVEVESLAPVKRLVISMADFAKIMTKKFGPAWRQNPSIERTCRFLPDGNVDVPVLYK